MSSSGETGMFQLGSRPTGKQFEGMTQQQIDEYWFMLTESTLSGIKTVKCLSGVSTLLDCIKGEVKSDDVDKADKDLQAKSWLFRHVVPSLGLQVHKAASAKAAWDMLVQHYRLNTKAHVHEMVESMATLRQRPGEKIVDYFARGESIVSAYEEASEMVERHTEKTRLAIIMRGVTAFEIEKKIIIANVGMTIENARTMLANAEAATLDREQQSEHSRALAATTAFAAGSAFEGICFNCGESGCYKSSFYYRNYTCKREKNSN
jgi:hypothetical protein